jgi:hypothetical protein
LVEELISSPVPPLATGLAEPGMGDASGAVVPGGGGALSEGVPVFAEGLGSLRAIKKGAAATPAAVKTASALETAIRVARRELVRRRWTSTLSISRGMAVNEGGGGLSGGLSRGLSGGWSSVVAVSGGGGPSWRCVSGAARVAAPRAMVVAGSASMVTGWLNSVDRS